MCVCVSHSVTSGSLWATCVCDFRLCVGVRGRVVVHSVASGSLWGTCVSDLFVCVCECLTV